MGSGRGAEVGHIPLHTLPLLSHPLFNPHLFGSKELLQCFALSIVPLTEGSHACTRIRFAFEAVCFISLKDQENRFRMHKGVQP